MKESIHSGHRKRVREKFLTNEFEQFNDHEIIVMLLFYAIPLKDTNPLAHELLNKFGSLSSLLDSPADELKKAGLSERAAGYLNFLPKICQFYLLDKNYAYQKKYSESDLQNKILNYCLEYSDTRFILILFDALSSELFFGSISFNNNSELINITNKLAVKYNASSVAFCTIMENGVAYPSKEDVGVVSVLVKNMNDVGIKLREWYIISDTEIERMSETNEFTSFFRGDLSNDSK